jgi:hypothetical protein
LQRAHALERLGHAISFVDPFDWIGRSVWMARWVRHAGAFGIGIKIDRPIFEAVKHSRPNLIWVDQGAYIGGSLIGKLRTLSVPVVNYTIVDPWGGRPAIRSLPHEENIAEAYATGARKVMRIWRSAD